MGARHRRTARVLHARVEAALEARGVASSWRAARHLGGRAADGRPYSSVHPAAGSAVARAGSRRARGDHRLRRRDFERILGRWDRLIADEAGRGGGCCCSPRGTTMGPGACAPCSASAIRFGQRWRRRWRRATRGHPDRDRDRRPPRHRRGGRRCGRLAGWRGTWSVEELDQLATTTSPHGWQGFDWSPAPPRSRSCGSCASHRPAADRWRSPATV